MKRTKGHRLGALAVAAALAATALALPATALAAEGGVDMYRLHNPNSGEHFYTASEAERDSLDAGGWDYEGVGWVAPTEGDPVYRLYNPNAGDHHYTTSSAERDNLVAVGWKYEGIGWRSGGSVSIWREYNPNAVTGTHNYTADKAEHDRLVSLGWKGEGVGWYGVGVAGTEGKKPATDPGEGRQWVWAPEYETVETPVYEQQWVEDTYEGECHHVYCIACGWGVYIPWDHMFDGGGLLYTHPNEYKLYDDVPRHVGSNACNSPQIGPPADPINSTWGTGTEKVWHRATLESGHYEQVQVGTKTEQKEVGGHWEAQ